MFLVIQAHFHDNYERYWNNDCAEYGQQRNQNLYTNPLLTSSRYTTVINKGKKGIWVFQLLLIISDYLRKIKKRVRFDRKNCQTALFLLYYLSILSRFDLSGIYSIKSEGWQLNKAHNLFMVLASKPFVPFFNP